MRIPENIIDDIRNASEVVFVIGSYVKLKKTGSNFVGLCPFHNEKTPSFSVSPSKQIWRCFGCSRSGNVFTFIMEYEKLNFVEAVRTLAEKSGIEIPESSYEKSEYEDGESRSAVLYKVNRAAASEYHKNLMSDDGEDARKYLAERGFQGDMLKDYGIGLAPDEWEWLKKKLSGKGFTPKSLIESGLVGRNEQGGTYDRFKNRIVFPVINESGKVVAFGGRIWQGESAGAKYVNSPESPVYVKGRVLYGLYQTKEKIRESNRIILVEGYTDFLSIRAAGISDAAATSGTALTKGQARLARRFADNAFLLYDGDSAGQKAAVRAAIVLLGEGFEVKVAQLPDGSDPDSFVREKGVEKLREVISNALSFVDFRMGIIRDEEMSSSTLKARTARNIVEEIIELDDELVKGALLKDFASRLGVEEELLIKESKKFRGFIPPDIDDEKMNVVLNDIVERTEYQLSMFLLSSNKEVYDSAKEFLNERAFSHNGIRNLVGLLLKSGFKPNQSKLYDEIDDPAERALLSKMLNEIGLVENELKTLNESKLMLQKTDLKSENRKLRDQLRQAEEKGEDASELKQQQKELTDKLRELES
ncbi:MAG: DNA primase [Candidatus Marinimicrobia bacterium]|nr:DNA primase [Candidatus Neomarinimicrobiota bacterium]